MAKIPVGDTISYAYNFTFSNLVTVAGLTWLPLLITAGISYYTASLMFDWLSKFFVTLSGANGQLDPQVFLNTMSGMSGMAGIGFLVWLVSLFLASVVGVAVTSQALGLRTGPALVHFAVGNPEWRVFGGFIRLLFAIIGVVIIAAIGIGISVFIGTAISGGDGSNAGIGGIVAIILCIAIYCLAILTIVRMAYLLVPTIVAEPGKGGLARSYHLTSGNFWRIFVVSLVLILPIAIVANIIQSAIIGNAMMQPLTDLMQQAQMGASPTPEQWQAAFQQMLVNFRANFPAMAIINFISSIFLSGLMYSGGAYAYRALSGTAAPAAT